MWRQKALFILLVVLFSCLLIKLVKLQVVEQEFLKKQGNSRVIRVVNVAPYRGMILDRNGEPLAVSTKVESVWINPKIFDINNPNVSQLLSLLSINKNQLINKLNQYIGKEFVYLKRHISPDIALKIYQLNISGVNFKSEYKRYYPSGEISAHVLGLTNLDDQGISGMEYLYNSKLQGTAGKKIVINDRLGREVEYINNIQDMQPGQDLKSSIDHRLQYLAHKELSNGILKHNAKAGSVVVLDVKTGEVLAMVNYPTFNPNEKIIDINSNKYRNIAVTDYFEPASSVKVFSMASVLEMGVSPNAVVDTNPGFWQVRGGVVKDPKNNGVLSMAAILQNSSNIGISKLVLENFSKNSDSNNFLLDMYDRVGFGSSTNSGFPGESSGVLNLPGKNQHFVLATMSFGYGMAVTPLQLARAYSVLGARGIKKPVSFLKIQAQPEGVRVINPKVADQVIELLSLAANRRASKLTKIEGYNIAGKTGTARKLVKNSYDKNRHLAVFCGLAPVNSPKFSVVVTVDEPSVGGYYGNQVAEPIFVKIVSGALRILNVPSDLDRQSIQVAENGTNHS